MKKYFILIYISLISTTAICGEKYIICGDDYFPPYSFTKDGKTVGIDSDLVRHVMKKVNIDVEIKLLPWKRLLLDLRDGQCDFAFSLFKTHNRQMYSKYLAPVHMTNVAILVNKSSTFILKSLHDLFDRELLVPFGFSISDDFDLARKANQISVSEVRDTDIAIKQLYHGRADGYINNSEVLQYYILNSELPEKVKSSIRFVETSIVKSRPAYLVVSKKSKMIKQVEVLKKIKKELENILLHGSYTKFAKNYLQ